MRIVVLHGQSHKGSTYHLAKLFCDKLGGEVTEFFLPGILALSAWVQPVLFQVGTAVPPR